MKNLEKSSIKGDVKLVVQRVKFARVRVKNSVVGEIGPGAMVLFGAHKDDRREQIAPLVQKLIHLRFFPDENDKTNLSLMDVKGELLVVSQFTLYANCKSGRRPSFIEAAPPEKAEALYEGFVEEAKGVVEKVETGKFGAYMQVELCNDGPFTLTLEDA